MVTAGGCNRIQSIKHGWQIRRAVAKARRQAEEVCRQTCDCGDEGRRRWWQLRAEADPPKWWFKYTTLGEVPDGVDWTRPELPDPEPTPAPEPEPEPQIEEVGVPNPDLIAMVDKKVILRMHSMPGCVPCTKWIKAHKAYYDGRKDVEFREVKSKGLFPYFVVDWPDGESTTISGPMGREQFLRLEAQHATQ